MHQSSQENAGRQKLTIWNTNGLVEKLDLCCLTLDVGCVFQMQMSFNDVKSNVYFGPTLEQYLRRESATLSYFICTDLS